MQPPPDHTTPPQEALSTREISVVFGGLVAVNEVDLSLAKGEILGLIGPNGAGKTTLLNAISGFVKTSNGSVSLRGRDITNWSADRRARNGLARSFQGTRLFGNLTVLENVEAGALGGGLRRRPARARAEQLLTRTGLANYRNGQARTLSAGDQHRLGVMRALALNPAFLLLDEPAAGLNEVESDELVHTVRWIRDTFECGILIIDHDMAVIMPLCERIQVLNYGTTICIGTPDEVRADSAVIEAYLGTRER
jgi:ABC-type branched-subunit amino acid transport system ATPase component